MFQFGEKSKWNEEKTVKNCFKTTLNEITFANSGIDLEKRITYQINMSETAKLFSMTGFSRSAGTSGKYSWNWEVKSVNGKGLDIKCRVPPGLEDLDVKARDLTAKIFSRGNIILSLSIKEYSVQPKLRVNRELLSELIQAAQELMEDTKEKTFLRPDNFFGVKGVIEPIEEETDVTEIEERNKLIINDLQQVLFDLSSARQLEGEKIYRLLSSQLSEINELRKRAQNLAESSPQLARDRLQKQINELLDVKPNIPEERIAQEVILLMIKMDVREELDRLEAHISAARELLKNGHVVGRKLDFLCQELNREVNTLCSKSNNIELSNIGLDLKALIEQFREQVQNIE